jgi:SAM-dependent methyltransferase
LVHDPYAVDARYYDTVHADASDDDIGLWLSFAGRTNRPVLEVGTGTGRVAIALARAGHAVTAIDPSPGMLALAQAKACGLRVDWREGRAEDVGLEAERYGFAVIPADVFLYCEDGAAQESLLGALAAALDFNGQLALDLPGPAAGLDPSLDGQLLLAFAGEGPDGLPLEAWHVREDDLALQTRRLTVRYETLLPDGAVRRELSVHRLRYVHHYEALYLLERAGVTPVAIYGDYELGPLISESSRMIVIGRRAGG